MAFLQFTMPTRRVKVSPRSRMHSIQPGEGSGASRRPHRTISDASWFSSFFAPRRRSSAVLQSWRNSFRSLPRSSVCMAALKMQVLVVRNAAESIACAWIPNACYALGNLFAGKWYLDQSRSELIIANSFWASVTYCSVVFISFLPIMMSFRYITFPDRRPSLWFCVRRLTRATLVYFLVATAAVCASSCLVAYLAYVDASTTKYKIDCYAVNLLLAGYFTGITREVKRIYYEETCQGRDRLQQRQQRIRRAKVAPSSHSLAARRPPHRAPAKYETPKFWLAYVRNIPAASVPLLACVFVHILSQQRIVDRGNSFLTGFVIACIGLKLAVQEGAKYYIFKKRVRSPRVMCVLVGIPTVLIDTQTRIIVLGSSNATAAAMGALGMALVEVSIRAGKAVLVIWEIRHRKARLERRTASAPTPNSSIVPPASEVSRPAVLSGSSDFELWRSQLQAFHTAELNADMYAEYISIGCSAAILFFYGNHPLYSRLRRSESADVGATDAMAWRVGQLGMLALQIGVEVVVDYVSILLEMLIGIEFDHVKNLGSFLAAMFMITAVMNINISVCIYLG